MSHAAQIQTTHAARTARTASLVRRIAILPLLAFAACDGGEPPLEPGPVEVAAVEVSAPAGSITVGGTMQLTATPRSGTGRFDGASGSSSREFR